MNERLKNSKGFTLIEILVVLIILGVFLTFSFIFFSNWIERSHVAEAYISAGNFKDVIEPFIRTKGDPCANGGSASLQAQILAIQNSIPQTPHFLSGDAACQAAGNPLGCEDVCITTPSGAYLVSTIDRNLNYDFNTKDPCATGSCNIVCGGVIVYNDTRSGVTICRDHLGNYTLSSVGLYQGT